MVKEEQYPNKQRLGQEGGGGIRIPGWQGSHQDPVHRCFAEHTQGQLL